MNRVVLSLEAGKFRTQAVDIGIATGARIEIRAGLSAGDRVVTSGQFLIDSESNIESALARIGEGATHEAPVDHDDDDKEPGQ